MSTPLTPLEIIAGIATRLADEGIPLRAIARALKLPSEDIREQLHSAIADGNLLEMPREDWDPKVPRNDRLPSRIYGLVDDKDAFCLASKRVFKLTNMQARLLLQLMKRPQVTREQLHSESDPLKMKDGTNIKIIDVVVHHIREKLEPHKIVITTWWGKGYFMDPAAKAACARLLDADRDAFTAPAPDPLPIVVRLDGPPGSSDAAEEEIQMGEAA